MIDQKRDRQKLSILNKFSYRQLIAIIVNDQKNLTDNQILALISLTDRFTMDRCWSCLYFCIKQQQLSPDLAKTAVNLLTKYLAPLYKYNWKDGCDSWSDFLHDNLKLSHVEQNLIAISIKIERVIKFYVNHGNLIGNQKKNNFSGLIQGYAPYSSKKSNTMCIAQILQDLLPSGKILQTKNREKKQKIGGNLREKKQIKENMCRNIANPYHSCTPYCQKDKEISRKDKISRKAPLDLIKFKENFDEHKLLTYITWINDVKSRLNISIRIQALKTITLRYPINLITESLHNCLEIDELKYLAKIILDQQKTD